MKLLQMHIKNELGSSSLCLASYEVTAQLLLFIYIDVRINN